MVYDIMNIVIVSYFVDLAEYVDIIMLIYVDLVE